MKTKIWTRDGFELSTVEDLENFTAIIKYQKHTFMLYARYAYDMKYLRIQDVVGNGLTSGYQRQGIGKLLVNTFLQYFKEKMPPDVIVTGDISEVDDPPKPEKMHISRENRCDFWRSFGFMILPGEWGGQKIEAALGDLKCRRNGLVCGKYPIFVPLHELDNL